MIVTIDGPAGTGKSSVARKLAEVLGFEYLDTGAMYRMVAFKTRTTETQPENSPAVIHLAESAMLDFVEGRAMLDGQDVSAELRSPDVTRAASIVAQIPEVRGVLVNRQREIAENRNVISEGRDQGTVVFPSAKCKFFLTADPVVRAQRRADELRQQGVDVEFDELLQDQMERDRRDEERAVAPLRPADDAEVIETSSLEFEEVVRILRERIEQRMRPSMLQEPAP